MTVLANRTRVRIGARLVAAPLLMSVAACGGISIGDRCGPGTHVDDHATCVPDLPSGTPAADAGDLRVSDASCDATAAESGVGPTPGPSVDASNPSPGPDASLDFRTACLVSDNAVFLDGDAKDFVFPGRLYVVGGPGWILNGDDEIQKGLAHASMSVDGAHHMTADFSSQHLNAPLAQGEYDGAQVYNAPLTTGPLMAVFVDGNGCDAVGGWFQVLSLTTGEGLQGLEFKEITVIFEQHCENAMPALRGCFHVRK